MAVRVPATRMNAMASSMFCITSEAAARSTRSISEARLNASTDSSDIGTRLIMRKMASSLARTGRRATPDTALRSPSGKTFSNCVRHTHSTEKKMKAAVAEPATTVIPKRRRAAPPADNEPSSAGRTMPHRSPASTQPMPVTPANT